MKLPFSEILNLVMKPYFGETRQFCQHYTFALGIIYIYFYGTVGFFVNLNHFRKHLGELPNGGISISNDKHLSLSKDFMLIHDLKIIATSMSVVQYACLLVGCSTENPALFLPHLAGQLVMLLVKVFNIFLVLCVQLNFKGWRKLVDKSLSVLFMTFNWLQEFCVFRQLLCICDL